MSSTVSLGTGGSSSLDFFLTLRMKTNCMIQLEKVKETCTFQQAGDRGRLFRSL